MKKEVQTKADTKNALLRAAEELFSERAYAEVGTREIAERAGVNLAAIKYHFGSKGQLFVDAVCGMLLRWDRSRPSFGRNSLGFDRDSLACTREEAIEDIIDLIDSHLAALCYPEGPQVCRIMYREILGASCADAGIREAIVNSVVSDFIGPTDERLSAAIAILLPQSSVNQRQTISQSIVAQCAFYLTHRVFYERLRGADFTRSSTFRATRDETIRFTLRGIGICESVIDSELERLSQKRGN